MPWLHRLQKGRVAASLAERHDRIFDKVQAHPNRPLSRLEERLYCVGDHRLEFIERLPLSADSPAAWRVVPARDVAARLRTGFDLEGDFLHARTLVMFEHARNALSPAFGIECTPEGVAEEIEREHEAE